MIDILLIVFIPFIAFISTLLFFKHASDRVYLIGILSSLFSAFLIVKTWKSVGYTATVKSINWITDLGINLSFMIDGLSVFFGLVVTLMGFFVVWYAKVYMPAQHRENGKFFAYLMLFMFAMLGTVFSNNLILLFIFWELTGVASFLLISFNYDKEASQIGSRMALIVTGLTGLIMLIGICILGLTFQTFEFNEIINSQPSTGMLPYIGLAFIFTIIGAFGKSAQFPFHFWLPNAMAAPTPVSAYLHSAAMVKLGIFLTARIYPVFNILEIWTHTLVIIGFLTMLIGAIFSFLSHDLKAILAYTTVSQLGYLIGFYGLGTPIGVNHDLFHIVNHVFYKGSLFMMAGIVIHAFHTKDIRNMGGAFKHMPLLGIGTIVACASMGGIPGTTGFLSKELMLEEILHSSISYSKILLGMLCISATLLIATGLRIIRHIFFGKSEALEHKPTMLFQLPPVLLALNLLIFGLFPKKLATALQSLSVAGLHNPTAPYIKLWHGLTPALGISLSIIIFGIFTYWIANRSQWAVSIPNVLRLDVGFNRLIELTHSLSHRFEIWFMLNKPNRYLIIVGLTFILILGVPLFDQINQIIGSIQFESLTIFEFLVPLLVIGSTLSVVFLTGWTAKLISLSVVGLLVSFYFFLYKAPDLALTQMLIEVVSLVLMVFLLKRFTQKEHERDKNISDSKLATLAKLVVSGGVGIIMFAIVYLITSNPVTNPIGYYFVDQTIPLAEGKNAVNTILVDFRGFDTMGEISVLTIAMLGVIGLLGFARKKESSQ